MSDRYIDDKLRLAVLRRDGYKCRYCGSADGPFHIDHVYPYSKGGETTIDNLVTACQQCNLTKHNTVGVWPTPLSMGNGGSYPRPRLDWIIVLLYLAVSGITIYAATWMLQDGSWISSTSYAISQLVHFVTTIFFLIYAKHYQEQNRLWREGE